MYVCVSRTNVLPGGVFFSSLMVESGGMQRYVGLWIKEADSERRESFRTEKEKNRTFETGIYF